MVSCTVDQSPWKGPSPLFSQKTGPKHVSELTGHASAAAFGKKSTQVYEAREEGEKARTLKLLRELVAGFAGVTDLPAIDFVPELLELYPDARVVLVTRDRERWWESFGKVLNMAQLRFLSVLAAPMPGLRWFPGTVVHWAQGCDEAHGGEKRSRDASWTR